MTVRARHIANADICGNTQTVMYELMPQSARRFSFIPDDLRYFKDHFICEPMIKGWELPPVTPHGVSYPAADFVLWMLSAPIVSERAKDALLGVCQGLAEFLPFHSIKGRPYFALNVISQDQEKPICKVAPSGVILVDDRLGTILRENSLSGVALADPRIDIGPRVVRGVSLHDFPGLVG